MVDIAFFVRSLVPTGILAAVFVWIIGRFVKPLFARAFIANAAALGVAVVIAGYGMANGRQPVFADALTTYALPQAIWLAVWIVILKSRAAAKTP